MLATTILAPGPCFALGPGATILDDVDDFQPLKLRSWLTSTNFGLDFRIRLQFLKVLHYRQIDVYMYIYVYAYVCVYVYVCMCVCM